VRIVDPVLSALAQGCEVYGINDARGACPPWRTNARYSA
jgi:hypothetical protein